MPIPSRHPLPIAWIGQPDRTAAVTVAAFGVFGTAAVGAVVAPLWFWVPFAIAGAAGVAVLAFRYTTAFCVAWLLIAGATLEMTLGDLIGPAAFSITIAVVKAAGMSLALVCILR